MPLSEPLSGADWRLAQKALNARLSEAGIIPDPANEGAAQLCYLPNSGQFYDSRSQRNGSRFSPLIAWANSIKLIKNTIAAEESAIRAEREAKRKRRGTLRSESVLETGDSLIGAFNCTHSVADILIQAGYDNEGNTFRHPNSQSGSFSASVKDDRVHSLSSSDPLYTEGGGIGAHDAFSAFTVLFHGGDQRKALIDAGNTWVMVEGESWNRVRQRKFKDSNAEYTHRPAFSLTHVSELLQQPEPLTWMLRDHLLPESMAFIIGPPAAGKSLVALDWAACVAAGVDWHGRSTDQGAVIYLAGEGHFGIRRRLMAWQCHTGISLKESPLAISDMGASLTEGASVSAVIEAIDAFGEKYGKPAMIVIDTLHRNFGAADENSAQDMGRYFTNLDILRSRYRCSVITVHHSGSAPNVAITAPLSPDQSLAH